MSRRCSGEIGFSGVEVVTFFLAVEVLGAAVLDREVRLLVDDLVVAVFFLAGDLVELLLFLAPVLVELVFLVVLLAINPLICFWCK